MSWQDVTDLESLASLNTRLAEEMLDNVIEHLADCREKLESALANSSDLKEAIWESK
jgi:hypothetical protein